MELEGKNAVVTGAGSGIGRGMARALAKRGVSVAVADIEALAAERTAREIDGIAIQCDVTDPQSIRHLAERVRDEFGRIDVLCNNAGVGVSGPLTGMTSEDWRWLLSVNVDGVVNCLQEFLPRMRAQGTGGHIVNTGSISGLVPLPGLGVYSATKAAVVSISEVLRTELAPDDIGVTVVCPGTVRTRILEAARNRPVSLAASGATTEREVNMDDAIDPDELGEQIADAVVKNEAYVIALTPSNSPVVDMLKARVDAIMDALP